MCGIDPPRAGAPGAQSYNPGRCYAFPIVTPGAQVVLKGFNFWDTRDALLEYRSLDDPTSAPVRVGLTGQGVTARGGHRGGGELPSARRTSESRFSHVRPRAGPRQPNAQHRDVFGARGCPGGQFFRIRMMNHNTDQPAGQAVEQGRFRQWFAPGERQAA